MSIAAAVGKLTGWQVAFSVASFAASLNVFNLVPVWQLDGSRGLRALSRGQRFVIAALGLVLAITLHQWIPAIVGVVSGVRAFGRDAHAQGDQRALALFAFVLAFHTLGGTLPLAPLSQAM